MKLFRSNKFWTILGSVCGFLALALTFFMFIDDQWLSSKALSVKRSPISLLLNDHVKIGDKELKVLYGNEEVKKLGLMKVTIKNNGGAEIEPTDFKTPLEISFDSVERIFSAVVESTNPQLKDVKITINSKSIILHPLLLNRRDKFRIAVSADLSNSREAPNMRVHGRISGIRKIYVENQPSKTMIHITAFQFVWGLVIVLLSGFIASAIIRYLLNFRFKAQVT